MEATGLFGYIIIFVSAVLAGSIPSGVLVTRAFSKEDIRKKGSGNIGATNVARVAGIRLGLFTLALDLAKGALPVYLADQFCAGSASAPMIVAALAAVGGHMYPVYTLFRGGGKGVATAAGCFLVISPWACLSAIVLFVLTGVAAGGMVFYFRQRFFCRRAGRRPVCGCQTPGQYYQADPGRGAAVFR